ncbi:hypothetical protein BDZ89DRAFT_1036115 [Hymenopellis radicata]|nr:hypothetical protein BDZ89DRAFT_1036115 [Hymenopellis radicata]
MRFHHFCCCMPLRVGVFVLTALALISSGAAAAVLWIALPRAMGTHDAHSHYKIVIGVSAAIYTIMALIALFGLIGTIRKRISFVRTFLSLLYLILVLDIAVGAFAIYVVYSKNTAITGTECTTVNGVVSCADDDGMTHQISKASIIVSFAVTFLISLYQCVLVHSYVKELQEKESHRGSYAAVNVPLVAGSYAPIGGHHGKEYSDNYKRHAGASQTEKPTEYAETPQQGTQRRSAGLERAPWRYRKDASSTRSRILRHRAGLKRRKPGALV